MFAIANAAVIEGSVIDGSRWDLDLTFSTGYDTRNTA